jgi:hypothetical protein
VHAPAPLFGKARPVIPRYQEGKNANGEGHEEQTSHPGETRVRKESAADNSREHCKSGGGIEDGLTKESQDTKHLAANRSGVKENGFT